MVPFVSSRSEKASTNVIRYIEPLAYNTLWHTHYSMTMGCVSLSSSSSLLPLIQPHCQIIVTIEHFWIYKLDKFHKTICSLQQYTLRIIIIHSGLNGTSHVEYHEWITFFIIIVYSWEKNATFINISCENKFW